MDYTWRQSGRVRVRVRDLEAEPKRVVYTCGQSGPGSGCLESSCRRPILQCGTWAMMGRSVV